MLEAPKTADGIGGLRVRGAGVGLIDKDGRRRHRGVALDPLGGALATLIDVPPPEPDAVVLVSLHGFEGPARQCALHCAIPSTQRAWAMSCKYWRRVAGRACPASTADWPS